MCLGTVAKVIEVHRDGRAVVEHDGRTEEVLSMTITDDDLDPGEWVVIHSGFALERISAAQAADALAIRSSDAHAAVDSTHAHAPHASDNNAHTPHSHDTDTPRAKEATS